MELRPPSLLGQIAGAALSGLLVVLAFPRYGYEVGLDAIVWVALVPLFLAAQGSGWKRGLLLGWCAGLTLEGAGFIWILLAIRRFTLLPAPVASLVFLIWLLYAATIWAFLGALLGGCKRPEGVWRALLLWTGAEHWFPRLFPWHFGGALYGREWLVQGADLLGASGLTALVLAGNLAAFRAIQALARRQRFPWKPAAGCAALVLGALVYGRTRLAELTAIESHAPRLQVALFQGALSKAERETRGLTIYLERAKELLKGQSADLLVWPEGADHLPINLTPGSSPWSHHREREEDPPVRLDELLPVPLVTGAGGFDLRRSPRWSNIAVFLAPGQPCRYYEKNVRLLFGEQVPFIDLIPRSWVEALDLNVGTIAAGTENPLFELGSARFRHLICYEATLPAYVRRAAAGADFLVNITEDIWYGRTAHIPQHVSVLILRTVENRVPLVRAANVGPSGVIGITGRFQRGEKVFEEEVVVKEVRPGGVSSHYHRWGHFFPLAALGLGGLLLALEARSHRRASEER